MNKQNETGHAVNASNFEKITLFADKLGLKYAPPTGSGIDVLSLTGKVSSINASKNLFHEKSAPWVRAVNTRSDKMDMVDKLVTKIKNLVDVCDVLQGYKDDVASRVREIHGVRAIPIVMEPSDPNVPTDESVVHISASQQGYDNKLGNFEMLYELLAAEPKYVPNEPELVLTAIAAVITDLNTNNTQVATLTPDVDLTRIDRNKELYQAELGDNELAAKVKKYIKAIYGGNSSVYHAVAKFKFTKLAKFVEN